MDFTRNTKLDLFNDFNDPFMAFKSTTTSSAATATISSAASANKGLTTKYNDFYRLSLLNFPPLFPAILAGKKDGKLSEERR